MQGNMLSDLCTRINEASAIELRIQLRLHTGLAYCNASPHELISSVGLLSIMFDKDSNVAIETSSFASTTTRRMSPTEDVNSSRVVTPPNISTYLLFLLKHVFKIMIFQASYMELREVGRERR